MSDEELIAEARRLWAEMRFSPSIREKLSAEVHRQMADRLEQLTGPGDDRQPR